MKSSPWMFLASAALSLLAAPPAIPIPIPIPIASLPQEAPPVEPSELKKLSIEELMEIDVTSVSRRSERVSQAAAAVTVITGEDIRRSGVTSLPEALRLANALHVARFDSRTWAISARGFNISTANKMLVLIDGRSVYTPLFSGVFWDVQDLLLEDVDRIEVIRGPGATLWGANAVNGVINIITKSARQTQGGLVNAGAGNEERGFGALQHGGTLGGRTWYRAYGKYRSVDALALARGGSAEDPLRMAQGGFRVDGDRSARDSFTLQGDVYDGRIGDLVRADTDVSGGNLLGRWSRRFSEASSLDLQVYWDRTHRRVPVQFEEHRDTWDVDLQHRLPFGGRHDLVWGLGYRSSADDVENSPVLAWVPGERTQSLFTVFAQDEIRLVPDRLRLTLGARLESHEIAGTEVQPTVRVAWTPSERQILWGAVSRAVRAPTRIDQDVRFLAGPVVVVQGSRDFDFEEVVAYELGYRLQPRASASVDLAAFYNVYDHLRSQERPASGAPIPITLANKLNAETYGAELRLNLQATPWWRLYSSYTYFHKDLSLDPGSTDPTGGVSEGNDPDHRFALRSYVDLPGRLELDTWLRYVNRLPSPRVPAYTELDLRLGWRATDRLELSLVGQNLLHDQHAEFFTAMPKEVERGVYGKATWRF
ncbi:MAG TPA: TonB-dependent receptor [Thermoanaerobaculia bacterium]|jgi:iron complex outermembrane receptor protein|nr:TonB-dependent receptor [Thermoanaerobaculia bacterium]